MCATGAGAVRVTCTGTGCWGSAEEGSGKGELQATAGRPAIFLPCNLLLSPPLTAPLRCPRRPLRQPRICARPPLTHSSTFLSASLASILSTSLCDTPPPSPPLPTLLHSDAPHIDFFAIGSPGLPPFRSNMPSPRSLRRQNPITFVLAGILCIGFFIFFFSSNDGASVSATSGAGRTSSSVLSPPSLPFRKSKSNGPQKPPPVEHYYMNNVTQSKTPIENEEKVLILTPLARFYQEYWDNLIKINYPHELISLGFIIPKTKEGNAAYQSLQTQITKTQSGPKNKRFASITILRQDTENPLQTQNEAERHKMENQKARRAAMAKARNSLLFTTLGPTTSWVLWLDADIIEFPPTLIQDLAGYDAPIIAPNCFQRYYNEKTKSMDIREYDYNNWVDSPTAKELAAKMGKDDILLEGYAEMPTYRSLMAKMYDASADPYAKIKLDGVGGAVLLVKADVHRDGAMFPPFSFYHLIETEGFAKMARRLNWDSYGLPNYLVGLVPFFSGVSPSNNP